MEPPPPRIGPRRPRRESADVVRPPEEQALRDQARHWIAVWTRQALGLPEGAPVRVTEEPHCVDPSCPLRKVDIAALGAAGLIQLTVRKPLLYVRQPDVAAEAAHA